jgi:hypothetical protein
MADDSDELEFKWNYEIRPLLDEYRKDGVITATKDQINELFGDK